MNNNIPISSLQARGMLFLNGEINNDDPVVLFKIVLIQYTFGICSMRQTINEIEVNMAYRWFLGYGMLEPIPHFTTFGKNYLRRFEGTDIFEQIFGRILGEAVTAGFVDARAVFIDATHIRANANNHKYTSWKRKNGTLPPVLLQFKTLFQIFINFPNITVKPHSGLMPEWGFSSV